MRKIIPALIASFLIASVTINAQSEKKEPPPPPPPPKPKEEVKYSVVKEEKVKPPVIIIDEKVNAGKPFEPPVITVKGKQADDFYKRNPGVSGISRQGSIITIKKKDGATEKYDLNKKEEDKSFTEKFGVSPIPPPPPPPKKVS